MRKVIFIILLLFLFLSQAYSATDSSQNVVKKAIPSTVLVLSYDGNGELLSQGSGFFISGKGEIITNYHVISGAKSIGVKTPSGAFYRVKKIAASDENLDLAKLIIDSKGIKFPYLKFSTGLPDVGERVIVVGNPLGLESTVSDGIVSGVRSLRGVGDIIQISAPISPGSSGGPVINQKGVVVGIAAMASESGQNLNFAIPAKYIVTLKFHKEGEASSRSYSQGLKVTYDKHSRENEWIKIVDAHAVDTLYFGDEKHRKIQEEFRKKGSPPSYYLLVTIQYLKYCKASEKEVNWDNGKAVAEAILGDEYAPKFRCNYRTTIFVTCYSDKGIEIKEEKKIPPIQRDKNGHYQTEMLPGEKQTILFYIPSECKSVKVRVP